MKGAITWLAGTGIGLITALAALNWPILLATLRLDLGVTEIHPTLGLLLVLAMVTFLPLFLACLYQQISTLVKTRGLLREVRREHELIDNAEALASMDCGNC